MDGQQFRNPLSPVKNKGTMKNVGRLISVLEKCQDKRDCDSCPLNLLVTIQTKYKGKILWPEGKGCQLVSDIIGASIYGEVDEESNPVIDAEAQVIEHKLLGGGFGFLGRNKK